MDRFAALFEQFSLEEVARVLRRPSVLAVGLVGLIALGAAIALSHPLVGVGACCGLGFGLVNIRLIARAFARVADGTLPKAALGPRTVMRLGLTTVIVLGIAVTSIQVGLGTVGGIALFYLMVMANLLRSMLKPAGGAAL